MIIVGPSGSGKSTLWQLRGQRSYISQLITQMLQFESNAVVYTCFSCHG